MRRMLLALSILSIGLAQLAYADDMPGSATHKSIGPGFHNVDAPIGVRWWLNNQKVGIDLGLGYTSTPSGSDPDEKVAGFAFDAGVPIMCHSWDRVHLLIRPGIFYQSQEIGNGGVGPTFDTRTETTMSILGEFEAEVFLVDNISISASHGIAFSSVDPDLPGVDSQSSFGTFGHNFTEVGFHAYFLGGGK